jgi:hypothetical protein
MSIEERALLANVEAALNLIERRGSRSTGNMLDYCGSVIDGFLENVRLIHTLHPSTKA